MISTYKKEFISERLYKNLITHGDAEIKSLVVQLSFLFLKRIRQSKMMLIILTTLI
jgi:hypothetical protein